MLYYVSSVEASISTPICGIPQLFDKFAVPGRREFDNQSLPGGVDISGIARE